MERFLKQIILLLIPTLFIACGQTSTENELITNGTGKLTPLDFYDTNYIDVKPKIIYSIALGTGKLIPIDFADKNYFEVEDKAKDTITNDGWIIKYFVKDDSTKYRDIYIQWTKGKRTGLYCGFDDLLMRRYFIPQFMGENDSYIFLTHGCATDCSALLALSKDNVPTAQDFAYVFSYNIKNGQLVSTPEYKKDTLQVSVVDLNRKQEKVVVFKNICNSTAKDGSIDSVHFDKNYISLFATLIDKNDKDRTRKVKENHIVKFYK